MASPELTIIPLTVEALSLGLIAAVYRHSTPLYRRLLIYLFVGTLFFTMASLSRFASTSYLSPAESYLVEAYFYALGFGAFLMVGLGVTVKPAVTVYRGNIEEFYGETR